MAPGSGAILGVGALLQAATVVRRLRSAAAGERDAAEPRKAVLPEAELAADDDQEDLKPECGERPTVVDRNHPSWAEVNAEQQERATDHESG